MTARAAGADVTGANVIGFQGKEPRIHPSAFLADGCHVIGDVVIEEGANIWFGAVLRGDIDTIVVGRNSSIQDNAVLHPNHGCPIVVGDHVIVGHAAVLHGCRIGDNSLVGIGARVLDRATVEEGAVVGAGSLVPEGKTVPARTLVLGVPAKPVREVPAETVEANRAMALRYAARGEQYRAEASTPRTPPATA